MYYYNSYVSPGQNDLLHYGVKGQKWGVRRYQNKDGTLTAKGRKRYRNDSPDDDQETEEGGKQKLSGASLNRLKQTKNVVDSATSLARNAKDLESSQRRTIHKKKLNLDEMTDDELKAAINRATLEENYNKYYAPDNISKGRKHVTNVLEVAGPILATASSALAIAIAIKELRATP